MGFIWGCCLDLEISQLWEYYKHLYPHFNQRHIIVYRALWAIEPRTVEQIIEETQLARSTVFKALCGLLKEGLVKKVRLRKSAYCAVEPFRLYSLNSKRIREKLAKGSEKIQSIISNGTGLSGELYLIQRDGGQTRILDKDSRQSPPEEQLFELRKTIDRQIKESGQRKLMNWAICK